MIRTNAFLVQILIYLIYFFFYFLGSAGTNKSEILIDLVGLDTKSPSQPKHEPQASSLVFSGDLICGSTTTELQSKSAAAPSAAFSLLDEELLSLGTNLQFKSSF